MELQFERAQLLVSAGLLDAALECMSEVKRQAPQNPRVLMEYVTLLSKAGVRKIGPPPRSALEKGIACVLPRGGGV